MVWSNSRWNPLHELARMSRELEQPLNHQARRIAGPRVDIWSDEHGLVLEAELSGLSEDAVELKLEPGLLILRGNWPARPADEAHRYHRRERPQGEFERRFRLSPELDLESVEAKIEHGLLRVRLARREEQRQRSVPIQRGQAARDAEATSLRELGEDRDA